MIISLSIKNHLAKFLIKEEALNIVDGAILLTKHRVIPNFIISQLVFKRKISHEKLGKKVVPVQFVLGDHFVKRGNMYINEQGVTNINSFLAKIFHWKLELYIQLNDSMTRKDAMYHFLLMYGIEPDIDVAMSAIKKTSDRYREDYPNVFPKLLISRK